LALIAALVFAGWMLRGLSQGALADDRARAPVAPPAAGARPTATDDHAQELARREAVLATFRGGRITVGDMEDSIGSKLPETRAQYADDRGRARFLSELVNHDVLALEAERRAYAAHPLVLETSYRSMIDLLIAQVFPLDPAAVPAPEVMTDLAAQMRQFERPVQRRASLIVVEREAEAKQLIAELKNGDRVRFDNVARERSRDLPSRQRGGDLGHFDREGKLGADTVLAPRAVASAVFALRRQGDIHRRPIPVDGGFGIVMWTGENPGLQPTRAQLEPAIRDARASQRQQRDVDELVAKLHSELQPELHPEWLDAIALDPLPAGDIPSGFPAAPPDPRAPPILVEPDAF
jgi:hypothetical protein